MTFDPNASVDRRSGVVRRGGDDRRSGVDRRRVVEVESHPPISDPNHPDHAEWQHEFVNAPATVDLSTLPPPPADGGVAIDPEEQAEIDAAKAEQKAADEAAYAAQAAAAVPTTTVDPNAPATPEPVAVEPTP